MEATTQGHWRVTHEGWIVEVSQGWETPAPVYGGSEEQVLAEAQSKITIELGGELRAEWVEEVAMQATETKHTPGPWKISECPTDREIRVVVTDPTTERCSIAIVASYAPMYGLMDADTKEDWANARLIAAAPELLAALKALVGPDGDLYCAENIRNAQAAIAKAEGR